MNKTLCVIFICLCWGVVNGHSQEVIGFDIGFPNDIHVHVTVKGKIMNLVLPAGAIRYHVDNTIKSIGDIPIRYHVDNTIQSVGDIPIRYHADNTIQSVEPSEYPRVRIIVNIP